MASGYPDFGFFLSSFLVPFVAHLFFRTQNSEAAPGSWLLFSVFSFPFSVLASPIQMFSVVRHERELVS